MTDSLSRIEKIDKLAEGGTVHPNAGMLWIPDGISESSPQTDDEWADDFTQELLEAMTQPIGDIPQGAYICCFHVKQEDYGILPDTTTTD